MKKPIVLLLALALAGPLTFTVVEPVSAAKFKAPKIQTPKINKRAVPPRKLPPRTQAPRKVVQSTAAASNKAKQSLTTARKAVTGAASKAGTAVKGAATKVQAAGQTAMQSPLGQSLMQQLQATVGPMIQQQGPALAAAGLAAVVSKVTGQPAVIPPVQPPQVDASQALPPEGGEAPKAPEGGEAPKAPEGGEAPKAPEGGEAPKAPEGGEAPKAPEGGEAPKPVEGTVVPEKKEGEQVKATSDASQLITGAVKFTSDEETYFSEEDLEQELLASLENVDAASEALDMASEDLANSSEEDADEAAEDFTEAFSYYYDTVSDTELIAIYGGYSEVAEEMGQMRKEAEQFVNQPVSSSPLED